VQKTRLKWLESDYSQSMFDAIKQSILMWLFENEPVRADHECRAFEPIHDFLIPEKSSVFVSVDLIATVRQSSSPQRCGLAPEGGVSRAVGPLPIPGRLILHHIGEEAIESRDVPELRTR
jgi:hypothetical protein